MNKDIGKMFLLFTAPDILRLFYLPLVYYDKSPIENCLLYFYFRENDEGFCTEN